MAMATKTYTVRVSQSAPEFTSEQVATWLVEQLASGGPLNSDPGPGDKNVRVTLEKDQVEQAKRAANETEDAVFLRRLIATRVGLESEKVQKMEEKPKPHPIVLPPRLRMSSEQLTPVVAGYDHIQAFAISRALKTPEAMAAARMTGEERGQIAAAATEVLNRRAPKIIVENMDVIGLVSLLAAIEFKKIDAAKAIAERKRLTQASSETASVPAENPAESVTEGQLA